MREKQVPKQVYDPIRRAWFEAGPEEVIRQSWIQVMLDHLGFPASFISVEKSLDEVAQNSIIKTDRRIDIMCHYLDDAKILRPLLLIECKAVPLNSKALRQVMGYQQSIQAPYVALANQDEIKMAYYDQAGLQELSFLPDFKQLVSQVKSKTVVAPHHL